MTKNTTNICSNLHSTDRLNPVEGLQLDKICVSPQSFRETISSDQESDNNKLFGLNPLNDITLEPLSVPQDIAFIKQTVKAFTPVSEKDVHHANKKPSQPLLKQQHTFINPLIEKAYHYSELTQIREIVFSSFNKTEGNVLLIASPHDNTGSSFLSAALGYNIACSCQKSVLLIDCNMRRAGLHDFFKLSQSEGFSDFVKNNTPWQTVIKKTGIDNLSLISAGASCDNFTEYLRYSHIQELLREIRSQFDFIIINTSPILLPNRNNVNIVSLTSETDYFLLVINRAGSTREHLKETQNIIEAGNGKINGIVINEHVPEKKHRPFST